MNILFVETSIDPNLGGIERVSYTNAIELEKNGHSCFFAYLYHDYVVIPDSKKIRLSLTDGENLNVTLVSFIIENKIDVVINQDLYNKSILRFYSLYKDKLGFKLINCFHLSPNFYEYIKMPGMKAKLKYFIYRCVYGENWFVRERRKMYDVCDKFVLLSESFRNDFALRYHLKDITKLDAIPNPLPFNRKESINLPQKQKIVLIVCRLFETQKNIKASLRIWKNIQRKGFHDWKLEIVGSGPSENMLKKYAKEIGLTNYEFKGKSSNVEEYYKKSSIFMMTSNYEGFGMTILEAQHFGCVPVVMDNFSVAHDLIKNGENGFLASPLEKDFENDLRNILVTDLSDIKNCAIKFSEKFKVEHIVKCWLVIINKIYETK